MRAFERSAFPMSLRRADNYLKDIDCKRDMVSTWLFVPRFGTMNLDRFRAHGRSIWIGEKRKDEAGGNYQTYWWTVGRFVSISSNLAPPGTDVWVSNKISMLEQKIAMLEAKLAEK